MIKRHSAATGVLFFLFPFFSLLCHHPAPHDLHCYICWVLPSADTGSCRPRSAHWRGDGECLPFPNCRTAGCNSDPWPLRHLTSVRQRGSCVQLNWRCSSRLVVLRGFSVSPTCTHTCICIQKWPVFTARLCRSDKALVKALICGTLTKTPSFFGPRLFFLCALVLLLKIHRSTF